MRQSVVPCSVVKERCRVCFCKSSRIWENAIGADFWARGYFYRGSGIVTDEIVKEYIEIQDVESEEYITIAGEAD